MLEGDVLARHHDALDELLRQEMVRRQPMLRTLLARPPNALRTRSGDSDAESEAVVSGALSPGATACA